MDIRGQVRNGLLQRGLPPHVADAFILNFQDESGLNPGINEIEPLVPGSRGGFGLYQLTGPRRVAYERFAQQRGVNPADVDAQLDFMMTELQGPESRAAESILAAPDTGSAAAAIVTNFLRPAEEHRNRRVAKYTGGQAQQVMSTNSPQGLLPTMEAPQMEQEQPRGLLGRLFNMSADDADQLRLNINGLLHNPNEGLQRGIEARMGGRAENRQRQQAAQQAQQQANRTAQWLASQPGGQQYAQAIASGALPAGEALTMWRQQSQGPEYRQVTGPEAAALGLDPNRAYNVGADGKITGIGAGDTNITVKGPASAPDDADLRKELMKDEGTLWGTYLQAGNQSAGLRSDFEVLDELIQIAPQGPLTGRMAEMFPGFNSAGAAFNSIVKRLAPTMRAEGSGSTSDIEYAGMLSSLPALQNRPEANALISQVMKSKAQVNMERAAVVKQYQSGQMDANQARQAIAEIDQRSIMTPEMKRLLLGVSEQEGGVQPQSGAGFNEPPEGPNGTLSDEQLRRKYGID